MLTDTHIRNAKPTEKDYRLADYGGLTLLVKTNGSKLWQYRFRFNEKANIYSIGKYPEVSLANARAEMAYAKALVKQGINPNIEKRVKRVESVESQTYSFHSLISDYLDNLKNKSDRTMYNMRSIVNNHVLPLLGNLPAQQVKPAHILAMLKELESAGKEQTAIKARQIVSKAFRYGIVNLKCETDPSSPLEGYVQKPPTQHAKALSKQEMKRLLVELSSYKGKWVTREMVLFQLLTFTRSIETINAHWDEIDFDENLWRIPAAKMKMKRDHLVPLTETTQALLRSIEPLTRKWGHVFPGADKRKPMGSSTINAALRYATGHSYGQITSHDFRATASTWLHEAGFNHDVIELQLAHVSGNKTSASYNHSMRLVERRELMEWWSSSLLALCEDVFKPRFDF